MSKSWRFINAMQTERKRHKMMKYGKTEKKNVKTLAGMYKEFLDAGKTERECADNIVRIAREHGYRDLEEILENGAMFFAIDVDDLTRYTCGLSRNDEGYRADTTAVLRLVSCVVRAAEARDVPVYLNGITTAELPAIPALLRKGGVRRFCTEKALLIPLKTTLMTVRAEE